MQRCCQGGQAGRSPRQLIERAPRTAMLPELEKNSDSKCRKLARGRHGVKRQLARLAVQGAVLFTASVCLGKLKAN